MTATGKKLGIKCGATKCDEGLHCFREKKRGGMGHPAGSCNTCGVAPIDWPRIHSRNLADSDYTLWALNLETVRSHFWNLDINKAAIESAQRKGRHKLEETSYEQVKRLIGPEKPFRDGWQTSMDENSKNALFFAQHATATCCRRCFEYWHGVPRGIELQEPHLRYAAALMMKFVDAKIPNLTENGS